MDSFIDRQNENISCHQVYLRYLATPSIRPFLSTIYVDWHCFSFPDGRHGSSHAECLHVFRIQRRKNRWISICWFTIECQVSCRQLKQSLLLAKLVRRKHVSSWSSLDQTDHRCAKFSHQWISISRRTDRRLCRRWTHRALWNRPESPTCDHMFPQCSRWMIGLISVRFATWVVSFSFDDNDRQSQSTCDRHCRADQRSTGGDHLWSSFGQTTQNSATRIDQVEWNRFPAVFLGLEVFTHTRRWSGIHSDLLVMGKG